MERSEKEREREEQEAEEAAFDDQSVVPPNLGAIA